MGAGMMGAGCCLLSAQGAGWPCKPGCQCTTPKPCAPSNLYPCLAEPATTPLISGYSDLAKPSLYLRLSPACPVLALAAGSCYLPTLREGEARNTGYALACAAAHSLARVLATAAAGVAKERAHICAEAISADLHSNAVSGPSTHERGLLPRSGAWTCPHWTVTSASLSYDSPVVRSAALPGETAAQIFET